MTIRVRARRSQTTAEGTPALLIEAGIKLFGARGYDGVTTRELAEKAQANISSIKYHFGGREALCHAILEKIVEEITTLVGPSDSRIARSK